jgi:hypothetical protein
MNIVEALAKSKELKRCFTRPMRSIPDSCNVAFTQTFQYVENKMWLYQFSAEEMLADDWYLMEVE